VQPNRADSTLCRYLVLREWLRIECVNNIGGTLLAGDPTDVKIWAWGDPMAAREDDPSPPAPGAQIPETVVVMPLRRGESRVFDLFLMGWGYDSAGPIRGQRISVMWTEGKEDPILIVRPRRHAWEPRVGVSPEITSRRWDS
jgi:hypothetical protein